MSSFLPRLAAMCSKDRPFSSLVLNIISFTSEIYVFQEGKGEVWGVKRKGVNSGEIKLKGGNSREKRKRERVSYISKILSISILLPNYKKKYY